MSFRLTLSARHRIAWLFVISSGLVLLAWGRLAYVQLLRHGFYEAAALQQRYRSQPLVPERGTIYDRAGVPLVMTAYGNGIYVTPRLMNETTASTLAAVLDVPHTDMVKTLNTNDASVWIADRVSPDIAQQLERLQLPGVYVVQRPLRQYPNGSLAADVLGLTGIDNQGLGGVEWAFDDVLTGVPGKFFSERDPRGRLISGGKQSLQDSSPAHKLVLTIDHVLQYVTEQELARGIAQAKASWGLALMLQPTTGEILASAVLPTFDPADLAGSVPRAYRNPAIADQFEPGSTLKVFTAAAALEEGLLDPDGKVLSPATLRIGGGTVNNYNYVAHGAIPLKEALAVSSNTSFAELGARTVGGQTLARYMRAFGFGQRLGVDLPGEGTGTVPVPGRVDGELLRWATVSFGHGIAVTPLQLAAATAAIANGGNLMQPFVVKQVLDSSNNIVEQRTPTVLRPVISAATARDVAKLMEYAIEHGTGSHARIPGYPAAGKTGTAQIPEDGRYGEKRLASFVGFAPLDNPSLTLVILLYDVKQDNAEGGRWAAPIFSAIMARALPHVGVAPRF